jgi:hypothetical protein
MNAAPHRSDPEVAHYVGQLVERSVPLAPEGVSGALVFIFRQPQGLTRATVRAQDGKLKVEEGNTARGIPCGYIFASLQDWRAYFEEGCDDRLPRIDLYGDLSLLEVLRSVEGSSKAPRNLQWTAVRTK